MAEIFGTTGNDVIPGTAAADVIDGGAGNDRITGGAGDDVVYGGAGNDAVNGETGNDTLYGGLGNDTLTGHSGRDTIYGEDGNDGIFGGGDGDWIWGGVGNDGIFGDGGDDDLNGGADNDTLNGGTGNDRLDGGTGDDVLNGDAGNDTLVIRAGEGNDTLNGGAGVDTIRLELGSADVTAALRADFEAYNTWMNNLLASAGGDLGVLASQAAGPSFTFASLGLTVSGFEQMTVTVDGQVTPISEFLNQAPVVAATASVTTNEDTALSGQVVATDADGDTLTWSVVSGPAHGTLSLNTATGDYTYTPGADYNGSDSFQVSVSDGAGGTATQTVSVGVTAVNDAPVAAASVSLSANEDTAVSGQVTASDVDGDTLSWSVASGPSHGTLSLNTATGEYTYTPGTNYSGSDSFQVTVRDPSGATATQTVSIGIAAVADTPALSASDVNASTARTLTGGTGNDTLTGGTGDDTISGGAGNDTLYGDGTSSATTVALNISSALVDTDGSESLAIHITGVPSTATLSAGTRNTDESWSLTAAQLAGLTMSVASAADVTIGVAATATEAAGDSSTASTSFNITFDLGGDNDTLDGGNGNDTLYGGNGNDRLIDGSDNDYVDGGAGNDVFVAGLGNDTYIGGLGFDTLDMSAATSAVSVNLATGIATGLGTDTISGFERVIGSSYNDTLTGTSYDSTLLGGDGNDTISGGGGNDTLDGGNGNDTINGGNGIDVLTGGAGTDVLNGGSSSDTAVFSGSLTNYSFSLGSSNSVVVTDGVGTDGADTLSNIETVRFGSQSYALRAGNNGANNLAGTAGDDLVLGFNGNDDLDGGAGADVMFGGAGFDDFIFDDGDTGVGTSRDIILDFLGGGGAEDIDLSAIDAVTGGGDSAFNSSILSMDNNFTADGQLRYQYIDTNGDSVNDSTLILGNVTGGAGDASAADFEILLKNYTGAIVAGDFIL